MAKMSPRRVAAALAIMGAATLAVLGFFSVRAVIHRDSKKALRQALDLVPGALLHAHNFHWTQRKGDHKAWELNASEASYSNDKTSLVLNNPVLSMVTEDGKTLLLHAARADLKLKGDHIDQAYLSGGLDLTYGDVNLTTTEATFWPDRDMIQGAGPVKVRMPGFDVTGVGLEAHPQARLFALQHEVRTEIKREAKGAGSKKS
jgi:LPS export ABC transporter protein LptC